MHGESTYSPHGDNPSMENTLPTELPVAKVAVATVVSDTSQAPLHLPSRCIARGSTLWR
ncbi:hypothetical protein SEVIR_2G146700v4 [Setaria viridis]